MNIIQQTSFLAAMGQQGAGGSSMIMIAGYMAIIFGIFYFMVIMPQKRKEKERKQLIDGTKTGDRVLFSGGILGTVTNVKEHTLIVKIADNVKIEMLRGAVVKVLEKEIGTSDVES